MNTSQYFSEQPRTSTYIGLVPPKIGNGAWHPGLWRYDGFGAAVPATGDAPDRPERVKLVAPTAETVATRLREPVARCLAAAFSSGPWAATPMPLGDAGDRHSARGILAELGTDAQAVVAADQANPEAANAVMGCVIGSLLDRDLVDRYGLEPYGARPGDALFAYIGVRPTAQGCRLRSLEDGSFGLRPGGGASGGERDGGGLASRLFSTWLNLPAIRRSPRIFIRTREVLRPIQALALRNGFDYCGKFYLDFQGARQDRMVYRRTQA